MAKAPWRCSQCGTVNEPVANSCRTCGRWPSLFDLRESAVGEAEQDDATIAEPEAALHGTEELEPETMTAGAIRPEPEPIADTAADGYETRREPAAGSTRQARGARQLVRLVIPIGVLLYFLITSYVRR